MSRLTNYKRRLLEILNDPPHPAPPMRRQLALAMLSTPGHVQRALNQLMDDGFVEEVPRGDEDQWRAATYRLTPAGQEVLRG